METLRANIVNAFGALGEKWLKELPAALDRLSILWRLTDIKPIANMTWNYVAKATQEGDRLVVIKISCDSQIASNEEKALRYLKGSAIELLDYNPEYHALLLAQAIPGTSLRVLYPAHANKVMCAYADVVAKLCMARELEKEGFPYVGEWLSSLDRADASRFPGGLLRRAINLKNDLLNTPRAQFFLHGDLHLDNIVSHKNEWLAIDPKGIMGEKEFEVACFDFIHKTEMEKGDVVSLFVHRAAFLASKLALDLERLKNWVFVRLILGACWVLEDNGCPTVFLEQAIKIFPDRLES